MISRIRHLGDTALLVSGTAPTAAGPTGIVDRVGAFDSTAIHFDPTQSTVEAVTNWLADKTTEPTDTAMPRRLEVPTLYRATDENDLETVASGAGLSVDEVIRRHAAAEYTVGAIGFQPGFPYLEGLPAELHAPRRPTPRVRVPAGSVGIGGPYTGVYPAESPGGWNLIGRTPLRLFDEHREEPSLLRVGDRVRFVPIDEAEFDRLAQENRPTPAPIEAAVARPLFRVISPGVQTTLQDLGQSGRQHLGISPGGAMDTTSLRLANLLIGNPENTPAIEATLVGPVLECLHDVTIGIAGAVDSARRVQIAAGERLDLRRLVGGARVYLAIPGGAAGRAGQGLSGDDLIGSLDDEAVERVDAQPIGSWSVATSSLPTTSEPQPLRVLRGPQADRFDEPTWRRFFAEPYRITPQSSRMGLRCEGPAIRQRTDESLPSQPVCNGVVQVPPDGQPIVLTADRQTLGGYPIIAVVASVDWPVLGQLRPGDAVRFVEIDLQAAQQLRREAERELAILATGIQLRSS